MMLRWLTLGAAAGAALTMSLDALGLDGPWQGVALVLALLALFASIGVFVSARNREREIEDAEIRARRDEAELGELQRELDRHTQLEQQLRQAKQAAEAAMMAKGEFLATMSHEIRTPLNGIVPMLDLLMHAQLAPDHAEMVRTAYTSSQQMLRIVDDILDYSKLEADKLVLESTGFNLRELLETVIQLMERPAQSKGLRLSLNIDQGVRLPVRGDPVRLRQVLGNLVSNAVKFTERGSITINVARTGETAAQHQLRFEVRDTGIGIAQEAQGRLFQAFSQADTSTTRLYGGTGLGLAISKRIVELMSGRIGVESEPGRGATFWFEAPLLKVQGDMPATAISAKSGGRLLLLSADPRLRLRLSMLLPNWGLRVSSVETTQEALDRVRTAANQGKPWAYSVVLADLPGIRNTAVALHRNISRSTIYGDLRLVCLYGEDPVPDELQRKVTLLSRQAPDADLRAALTNARPATTTPDTLPREAAATPPTTMVPRSANATPLRSPRVLLVETNPVNPMVGQPLPGMLGLPSHTAPHGAPAQGHAAEPAGARRGPARGADQRAPGHHHSRQPAARSCRHADNHHGHQQRQRHHPAQRAGPPGRGQPCQPDGRPAPARRARHHLRHRQQRRGGADADDGLALRPGADGLPDAGDGRLHRHPPLARARGPRRRRPPPADRGDDRQRDGRRPPEMPGRRHGRLPAQAGHEQRARALPAPLVEPAGGGDGARARGRRSRGRHRCCRRRRGCIRRRWRGTPCAGAGDRDAGDRAREIGRGHV